MEILKNYHDNDGAIGSELYNQIKTQQDHKKILGYVTTYVVRPVAEHLFKITWNGKCLNKDQEILLHWIVENMLFVSKWPRPNIQTTIKLLTTRV